MDYRLSTAIMASQAQAPASSTSRRPKEPDPTESYVGQFKKQVEIGKGSFATVFRAIHTVRGSCFPHPLTLSRLLFIVADMLMQKNRSLVAIKSVHMHKLNKKLRENLQSEIHILKGLHHPHIVALIDCQESPNHIHLVMEFCQLGDLSYFIKKRDRLASFPATADMMAKYPNQPGGFLNEVIVRHFLKQLASALEFLRAKNCIHRDVKPQNLLLNPSPLYTGKEKTEVLYEASEDSLVPVAGVESLPMLKVADFGFARFLPSTSLAETLCGSPLYMAPEILRYEKYDAKADLWSVGTVLYEMVTGRPPFRASNHVELLRKIERGDDRIAFPDGLILSDELKGLTRALLKRNPVERMDFKDLFGHAVVTGEIPGLLEEDRPRQALGQSISQPSSSVRVETAVPEESKPQIRDRLIKGEEVNTRDSRPRTFNTRTATTPPRSIPVESRNPEPQPRSGTSPRSFQHQRRFEGTPSDTPASNNEQATSSRRPPMVTRATAPVRHDPYEYRSPIAVSPRPARMERQVSRNSPSPASSLLAQQQLEQDPRSGRAGDSSGDVRERAEQEIAFERDYVLVEKRAVEVNAFADELAASPKIHGGLHAHSTAPNPGAITRRATTQGTSPSSVGTHQSSNRAVQVATSKQRPDYLQQRKNSYERRYGASPGSATSAISKALNMANFRLFGVGFSPPFVGKGGHSPPQAYGAFPAYPTLQGSMVMIGDPSKPTTPHDEDARAVHIIEEAATRSDVVYGFAEVKYKQLIPLAPSIDHGLGLRSAAIAEEKLGQAEHAADVEEGLTIDVIVTLSEEALVLYVKALALLARSINIAGAWWARKNRAEGISSSPSSRQDGNAAAVAAAGNRINNVVQWVRNRFNEVLEKAEFVRLKLLEAQKQLPVSHPSHPSNHPLNSSSGQMGTSAEPVIISSGVTAEKLMYERALEMSRAAAVNELVGEDLPGCEIAYITAVRMLEAVLETDDEPQSRKSSAGDAEGRDESSSGSNTNGVQAEDLQIVEKRKLLLSSAFCHDRLTMAFAVVASLRLRLSALRKKIAIMAKRQSAPPPPTKAASTTDIPTVAGTPP